MRHHHPVLRWTAGSVVAAALVTSGTIGLALASPGESNPTRTLSDTALGSASVGAPTFGGGDPTPARSLIASSRASVDESVLGGMPGIPPASTWLAPPQPRTGDTFVLELAVEDIARLAVAGPPRPPAPAPAVVPAAPPQPAPAAPAAPAPPAAAPAAAAAVPPPPAPAAAAAEPAPAAPEPPPPPPAHDPWLAVRICESNNNYATNTGNGFFGAYQFTISTWNWVAGMVAPEWVGVRPDLAPPWAQDRMANALAFEVAGGGLRHWPHCGRRFG